MKKTLLLLNFTFFILHFAVAQNPLVKIWDKRFGGTDQDWLTSFQQTKDGGYILGGLSWSGIGGDKSQTNWGGIYDDDYWIIKIDSIGNKQWDRRFGGTSYEALYCLQQTSDNGYILGGISGSGINGDKTQSYLDTSSQWWYEGDYWIIKIDSIGNKQWDKRFGGMDRDVLTSLEQTTDGGYILGGYSNSGISGDKTQPCWDPSHFYPDYWIIKIDSLGNIQWDKTYGGTAEDQLTSLRQLSDGGYILGGWSWSGISGDKTQINFGLIDYWIIKIDGIGNKQWEKDYGGPQSQELFSLFQTNDKGFILGGWSGSGIGGNKTQTSFGSSDFWMVKTDSLGNMQWDKDFGGTDGEDEIGTIRQTSDSGFLMAGTSYSDIGGNKTDNNLGSEQSWIIKTDSLGNKQWDKTLHTNIGLGHDECGFAVQTKEGCYAIANYTHGGIGGDKTQPTWDTTQYGNDYWIIKFCETPTINFIAINSLCPGTCTNFTNLSFNATSYQWNFPGAIPGSSTSVNPANICYANPGTYDVELIATNSNGSDTLLLTNYITVYHSPPPQAIMQSGDSLFALAGAATYQWYFNASIINGATNYFYIAPQSGDYNVVATDSNGCEVEAVINNVIANTTSLYFGEVSEVRLYPNPAEGELKISNAAPIAIGVKMKQAEIKIYSLIGVLVLQSQNSKVNSEIVIDVSSIAPGLYYVEISEGEKVFWNKFVKR